MTGHYLFEPEELDVIIDHVPVKFQNNIVRDYCIDYHPGSKAIKRVRDECGFITGKVIVTNNRENMEMNNNTPIRHK